jgi:hypothetical protein
VLYQLVIAYEKCFRPDEAMAALQDLNRRFPDSAFRRDAGDWEQRIAASLLKKAEQMKAAEQAKQAVAPTDTSDDATVN